ncbi:TetR/AcrR family transcriptional regulator [Dactylosporangium sucinum]|uniref:Transcriptional regulator TetR family protein n=1 Tax=Dactylosporangium sucinum TaxID=1424081 RepID=A0A917U4Z9_9ACTN|nr:TetR/AcrR family transcriptional regulator [Dactylosporangium sucinum]GGM58941.1 putative transcriptional regulator TetR family protein [Dactylosporangium sucinum]
MRNREKAPYHARREAVLAVARDLFAERGYRATTVRDIADASGVLSGSLYHYFDSKETLIDEMLSSYLDELTIAYRNVVAQGGDAPATLARLVAAAFAAVEKHRAAGLVLHSERHHLARLPRFAHLVEREEEIEHLWSTVIERGKTTGQLRPDIDEHMTYRFVRDGICAAARWSRPATGLAEQFLSLLLDGLRG